MSQDRRIDPKAFRNATILVAEGNRAMRHALRNVLLGMGFPSIILTGSVAETMRQLMIQTPSVLLLDHKLPGGDGLALTRRLRRDREDVGRVPIILMAETPDAALVMAARDAGVHEIVVKPPAVEALVRRLMYVLKTPRPFVRVSSFIGPDRRRLNDRRRGNDRRFIELEPEDIPNADRRQRATRRTGKDRRRKGAPA
ncbi:response regulator [Ferrovibrio sp.]|uniref:response regulator n=1 Tax=Ferrovibrio sp. TaxID=1917215 RepID=UPI00261C7171|nr:response regulator [Ferrovibrio sp.]